MPISFGGNTYTDQQVKDFYAQGGDDTQFAYNAGVTDPWQRRELLLQARGIAGNAYSGDAALKHYYDQYKQATPNGAFAGNYQGWLNDVPQQVKDAMKSGSYTGQGFAPKDHDFGGIYGPGTGHDVSFEQSRYGVDPTYQKNGTSSGTMYAGGNPYFNESGGGIVGQTPPPAPGGSYSSYTSSSGGVNPYLDQMAGSITNQLNSNWERNLAPSIRSGAMAAGGFGGSRQGVVEANGLRDLNQTLGNSLANLYGTGWQNAQQNALQNKSLDNNYALGVMNNNLGYSQLDANNSQFGANLALNTLNAQNNWAQNGVNAANQMYQMPLQYQQYFNQMQNNIAGQGGSTSQQNQGNPALGFVGGMQLANSWIK